MKISIYFSGLNNYSPDWQKVNYERRAPASETIFNELLTYSHKECMPQTTLISENESKIIAYHTTQVDGPKHSKYYEGVPRHQLNKKRQSGQKMKTTYQQ